MEGGIIKTAMLLICLVLALSSVYAITATLVTGAATININETPITVEKSIGVRNDNNQTAYIFFEPATEIKDQIVMEAYNISLEPGEQRFVKFNFTILENKPLESKIVTIFSSQRTQTILSNVTFDKLAMEMKLIVRPSKVNNSVEINKSAEQNSTYVDSDSSKENLNIFLLVGGVILVLAIAIIIFNSYKGKQ
ncbi:MAG: hypothetical protein ABIJ34_04870 [archaeon]